MKCIFYQSGYKYQLKKDYSIQTNILPDQTIATEFLILDQNGVLLIKDGYAWDGPSGPTIDTPNFMRGSLVHDALYQLMKESFLNHSNRIKADILLRQLCREDGMSWFRAFYVYWAVRLFADFAAEPVSRKKTHKAPRGC